MKANGYLPILLFCAVLVSGCASYGKNISHRTTKVPERHMFTVYTKTGELTSFSALVSAVADADVVLIGETHTDSTAHTFEEELLKAMFNEFQKGASKRELQLSLEFFEKDVQIVLDEYLSGLITERHLLMSARTWPNYRNAHRPLVEFSKANMIPVIAANAPRRYVNLVSREGAGGLHALSAEAKSWLPPLPYQKASERYRQKLSALQKRFKKSITAKKDAPGLKHSPHDHPKGPEKGNAHFSGINPDSQALWDAAMAWSIAQAIEKRPKSLVININGKFHSDEGLGIPEHLVLYAPGLNILTISILPGQLPAEKYQSGTPLADFIITPP